MRKLLQQMERATRGQNDDWLTGVEGIVAINEDPENQHRVKVVIPALDEEQVYDKWVRQIGVHVLGPGYGSFFVPPVGGEVILFGRLGQKHNLYYLSVYNEDFVVPADFRDTATAGIRAPADLKFIADGDLQLRAGGLQIETDGAANIIAPGGLFINGRSV
jgi:hypothetical protein